MASRFATFLNGIWTQNPTFVIVLGMCPTLATTISLENAIGMGLATMFVLVASNFLISSSRKMIPDEVRIPMFVVIIATFVTVVSMFMEAYTPVLFASLGIYIPLIVVNCIIMGRAEAFAYKNTVGQSVLDGLGMGVGFTLALSFIGMVRELIGTSKIIFLGHTLINSHTPNVGLFLLAPGGYLVMGLILMSFRKFGRI